MQSSEPYNPLDKRNLAESVTEQLLKCEVVPVPPQVFNGAGVYALYYIGDFDLYAPIASANKNNKFAKPIYVGKAVPRGSRKGSGYLSDKIGNVLYDRLTEHKESISAVANLRLNDFYCRYLTVDDIWIPLGESLLIEKFRPIWNLTVEGFGNHDPGSGRKEGKKPKWDVLHPGRPWADKLKAGISEREVRALVQKHLTSEAY